MVVLASLRSALAGLARNPVLFLVAGVVALVQLPYLGAQWLGPLVASLVSLLLSLVFVLVFPFVQAGLLGMADEAIDGRTSLGTFVEAGRARYLPMLVAYLLLFATLFVYWVVVIVGVVLYVLFVLGPGGSPARNPASLAVGVALAAVVAIVYLGFVFFVQFYGQAIVVDDLGAMDGYRRSVRLVRRNLLPTLGYFLLAGVAGLVFGGLAGAASLLVSPEQARALSLPSLSAGGAAVATFGVVVLTALFTALFMTFSVAFYRAISTRESGAGATPAAD